MIPVQLSESASSGMKKLDENQQMAIVKAMKHNPNFRAFVDGANGPSVESIHEIAACPETLDEWTMLNFDTAPGLQTPRSRALRCEL